MWNGPDHRAPNAALGRSEQAIESRPAVGTSPTAGFFNGCASTGCGTGFQPVHARVENPYDTAHAEGLRPRRLERWLVVEKEPQALSNAWQTQSTARESTRKAYEKRPGCGKADVTT